MPLDPTKARAAAPGEDGTSRPALTPADYLTSIVFPTLHEFTADPSDRRRAYLACIVAAHLVDHIAKAMKKPQSDIQSAVRAQGAFAGECLDLVEAICKGVKHAAPDQPGTSRRRSRRLRPEPIQFAPGWERAVKADSLGGVLAAHRHRRWERPGLTVELSGKEEGAEDRFIDECVEGLIAAAVMAFPGLFPDIKPLSVAPWLQPSAGAAPTVE